MKLFILLLLLFPLSSQAKSLLSKSEFVKLPLKQKAIILQAYKEFIEENSKIIAEEYETVFSRGLNFSAIEEAYAAENYDCFYGGWPSVKKTINSNGKPRSFCSSPAKSNVSYQKLSQICGPKQMLCQPVLFGSGLCIETGTSAQRNSSFSQCQKKSDDSGKTIEEIVKEASANENSENIDELFELVHDICENGFQSSTGMCRNLKAKIDLVKAVKVEPVEEVAEVKEPVVEAVEGEESEVENNVDKKEVVNAVETVIEANEKITEINHSTSGAPELETVCAEKKEEIPELYSGYSSSEPVDQSKVTDPDYCAGGEDKEKDTYTRSLNESTEEVGISIDYQGKTRNDAINLPGGYSIHDWKIGPGQSGLENGRELANAKPVHPDRVYENSFLGRGKESSFKVIDRPVSEIYKSGVVNERYLSTDMRITEYAFFPRKVVPSVKMENDKVVMKMTTGEEVVVDAKTGQLVGGVAKEVAAKNRVVTGTDRKGDNFVKTYSESEFSYTGEGLYIQSYVKPNNYEKLPGNVVSAKARVDGIEQECKLKSDDIWVTHKGQYQRTYANDRKVNWSCTKFKFEKDKDLYELIKKTCPDFKFPALVK